MSFGFKVKLTMLLAAVGIMTASVFCYAADFGLGEAGSVSGLTKNKITEAGSIPAVLGDLVGIALSLLGIFFFILVLYAGFIWMTAAGSGEQVDKAKKILMSGAIGLVIVLSAYTITSYVFTEFLAGAPTGQTGGDVCKTGADGQDCGDNSLCLNKKCVSECVYTYGTNAKCKAAGSCAGVELTGFCPGGTNNKCCVPQYDYDFVHKVSGGTSDTGSVMIFESCSTKGGYCIKQGDAGCGTYPGYSEIPGNFSDCSGETSSCCVNSCRTKGGMCLSANECSNASGKEEAESCGDGQVCCVTCVSQGGSCFFSGSESCSGKVLSGSKNGCGTGLSCCIGGFLQ
ncbi:MAG: hypothetical protein COU29_02555 [Candidatus Magasanikbacteria bacterium CG10_big_fil_rev_8_21_14_0_10_36_32]|uniref:Uncharacterized protein n=1 Tax=Candidatus Magasanikbacteria bacterium CG10_big_fil_rev_8_21_14_0_10_36_32 TaxID=1974646 RepID=A0A2M6W771_9BACT|nr:MAG: hypothetical protein COU29_02555 [Candidatus Magasanikbacteria bacterium CG10_big_fil_rev_8_21_14_0_10_36_32]